LTLTYALTTSATRLAIRRARSRCSDGSRPVPRSTIPRPSSSRKKVKVITVIAARRCSSRLTVNDPSVLAPLLRWEGRPFACSDSLSVMPYFSFSSWNCSLFSAQSSTSET
jgi:hypothetical protein